MIGPNVNDKRRRNSSSSIAEHWPNRIALLDSVTLCVNGSVIGNTMYRTLSSLGLNNVPAYTRSYSSSWSREVLDRQFQRMTIDDAHADS